jgi:hypothetical protein
LANKDPIYVYGTLDPLGMAVGNGLSSAPTKEDFTKGLISRERTNDSAYDWTRGPNIDWEYDPVAAQANWDTFANSEYERDRKSRNAELQEAYRTYDAAANVGTVIAVITIITVTAPVAWYAGRALLARGAAGARQLTTRAAGAGAATAAATTAIIENPTLEDIHALVPTGMDLQRWGAMIWGGGSTGALPLIGTRSAAQLLQIPGLSLESATTLRNFFQGMAPGVGGTVPAARVELLNDIIRTLGG